MAKKPEAIEITRFYTVTVVILIGLIIKIVIIFMIIS